MWNVNSWCLHVTILVSYKRCLNSIWEFFLCFIPGFSKMAFENDAFTSENELTDNGNYETPEYRAAHTKISHGHTPGSNGKPNTPKIDHQPTDDTTNLWLRMQKNIQLWLKQIHVPLCISWQEVCCQKVCQSVVNTFLFWWKQLIMDKFSFILYYFYLRHNTSISVADNQEYSPSLFL